MPERISLPDLGARRRARGDGGARRGGGQVVGVEAGATVVGVVAVARRGNEAVVAGAAADVVRTGTAREPVVAAAAAQRVVAGAADDAVVERVAGAGEAARAGERQVLDIGAQGVGAEQGFDRIRSLARQLDDLVADRCPPRRYRCPRRRS